MTPGRSRRELANGLGVLAAVQLTVVLLGYLLREGFLPSRVALFLALSGLAWLGALGIVRGRPGLATAGATGLVLLGFWQAVLWIWLLPTAGLLFVAVALSGTETAARSENGIA